VWLGIAAPASAALFAVEVERGTRTTAAGDVIAYDLYRPVPSAGLPAPPWPAVILNHGFARDRSRHALTAFVLAQRGLVVLTPDLLNLLGGEQAQIRNIANTVDHVRWLRTRTATEGDALYGRIDTSRIALAGHSAGASISLEAAIDATAAGIDIAALVLLDGVPWPRTISLVPRLPPLSFVSLRSESGPCNAFGSGARFVEASPVPVDEITITGATHCDPENPTDALCAIACGGASAAGTLAYQRLFYLFLQDRLPLPSVETAVVRFDATVDGMVAAGSARRRSLGPTALPRLKINGRSPADGIVPTAGTARVTLDVFVNAVRDPLEWYVAVLRPDGISWITPAGPSAVPVPIAVAPPQPLRDAEMGILTLEPGAWSGLAIVFARNGVVIGSTAVVAVRDP
jgi:dienelactone hydrolase